MIPFFLSMGLLGAGVVYGAKRTGRPRRSRKHKRAVKRRAALEAARIAKIRQLVKAERYCIPRRRGDEVCRQADVKRDCATGKFVPRSKRASGCELIQRRLTRWWNVPGSPREQKACYATKGDALRFFREWNRPVIDAAGGEFATGKGGEFDAVNERYGLKGKRKVKNIAQALEVVMPSGKPYCLDQLDLDALNETGPAQQVGPFTLPDVVLEQKYLKQEQAAYEREAVPF